MSYNTHLLDGDHVLRDLDVDSVVHEDVHFFADQLAWVHVRNRDQPTVVEVLGPKLIKSKRVNYAITVPDEGLGYFLEAEGIKQDLVQIPQELQINKVFGIIIFLLSVLSLFIFWLVIARVTKLTHALHHIVFIADHQLRLR